MVKGRKNIRRVDLIDALCAEMSDLTKANASEMVDTVFETIKMALIGGDNVRLDGLGNVALRDKTARRGRNPQTGEPMTIADRRTVTFKVASSLKQSMNEAPTSEAE